MSIKIIQDRLNSYNCKSELEEEQVIREITQEVALAALGRTDFFKHAAFQGGTCLRIFYGLNRFSEDMDFILKEPQMDFKLKIHLQTLADELAAYGYNIEIIDRDKSDSVAQKAFLKDDSIGKILQLQYKKQTGPAGKIRIKFEIDTNPPSGSNFELKYLDFPFISSVIAQDQSSLFAGKVHALLCRAYVKGRDWYDFLWYSSRKSQINYTFLTSALNQLGPWQGQNITADYNWCQNQLKSRIETMNWPATADDVRRFLPKTELPSLTLWSNELFLHQLDKIR